MMPRSRWFCWVAISCLTVPSVLSAQLAAAVPPEPPSQSASQHVTATMLNMPLQFEANHGQVDAQVKFLAKGKGYTLFLTPTESVMVLQQRETTGEKDPLAMTKPTALREPAPTKQAVVRMKLEGANQAPAIEGIEKLPGIVNYFIGNDPKKWHTEIPTYAKVQYQEAYPGIDLAYYGNQGKLEYDFIVAPGADPNQIRLAFEGGSDIRTAGSGDLLLTTTLGEVRLQKPLVYQLEPNGHKTLVAGQYVVHKHHSPFVESRAVQIRVAAYDQTKALVIDPVLSYSTYLGGNSNQEIIKAIAVDASGSAYVTGSTSSTDFPTTVGAFQATRTPAYDIPFVTKLNPSGSALVYSTYLSDPLDPAGDGQGLGIAVDALGNAYITGYTRSNVFPVTPGAFQTTCYPTCFGAFVTKLNPSGSGLVYSTLLGPAGSRGFGIAVDGSGNAYVTGRAHPSWVFPTTPGAFQTTPYGVSFEAFVAKLNPTGSNLVYSTYLSGTGLSDTEYYSAGASIAVDGSENAYVTGDTGSANFPTTPGAFQTIFGGTFDAFVTKLNPTGSALVYSTYLGGTDNDGGTGIAIDASGNAYITGYANSVNFPTTPGAFRPTSNGGLFVTKLNPIGSELVYSTYLSSGGTSIAIDGSGNAHVTGGSITKLNPTGSDLVYSMALVNTSPTSIAVDSNGNAYVAGQANSSLSTTPGVVQPTAASSTDAFVAKISDVPPNQNPVCSAAVANPNSLWQPDGRMVPIAVTGVTDPDGNSVTTTVTTVTQDEPIITKSKKWSPDAVIQGGSVSVRAERWDKGNGRVYQISFQADDGKGGSCIGSVKVGVPLNLNKGLIPIDDGQNYSSTTP